MKRCPICHRFGVEYDSYSGVERCLWNDCLWVNREGIDLDQKRFPTNFKRFRDRIRKKESFA